MLMPLKRYAEFSGRSRRMEYWMFQLFLMLVYVAIIVLMMAVGGGALMSGGGDPNAILAAGGAVMILGALYFLFALAMFIPALAVAVRRLHDTNRSGWWLLAPLAGYVVMFLGAAIGDSVGGILAIVGTIAVLGLGLTLIVFMFLEGTRGPNNYGPDPKGEALDQVFA
jgi:uncharacterized membrane protein YhaH (DUF805 family)